MFSRNGTNEYEQAMHCSGELTEFAVRNVHINFGHGRLEGRKV